MATHGSSAIALAQIRTTLTQSGLFAGLPPDLLVRIAATSVRKNLARRQFLFWKSTPVGGVFIVESGAVALRIANGRGKECILQVCHPFESFAEEAIISQEGYPADAYALVDSRLVMVQKEGLIYLLKRNPEIGLCLLRKADRHMRRLLDWLHNLTQNDVPTRLVEWLLQHCADRQSQLPCSIALPATKRLIASELGTIPETFSRTLARLQSEGLVEVGRKSITLVNPRKLARLHARPTSSRL